MLKYDTLVGGKRGKRKLTPCLVSLVSEITAYTDGKSLLAPVSYWKSSSWPMTQRKKRYTPQHHTRKYSDLLLRGSIFATRSSLPPLVMSYYVISCTPRKCPSCLRARVAHADPNAAHASVVNKSKGYRVFIASSFVDAISEIYVLANPSIHIFSKRKPALPELLGKLNPMNTN